MTDQILPMPEMTAEIPDLLEIDTMSAIKMGTRNLKKFLYEIQEQGKKLDLVVKVEPANGGLLLWWYPKSMEPDLKKLSDEIEGFDLNGVGEFTDNSAAYLGDDGELRNTDPAKDVGPRSEREILGESDGTLDNTASCFPSLGEPCGNCHRCTGPSDETLADDSPATPA